MGSNGAGGFIAPRHVLVTGGAGFIGSAVAAAYRDAGWQVTVLDNLSTGRRDRVPEGVGFVLGDIRSSSTRDLLASGRFSLVNHHAAQTSIPFSVTAPALDVSVNVLGTLNVLEGAVAGKVPQVLLASSSAVYAPAGPLVPLPYNEGAPKLPLTPYGASKLAAEVYGATFARLHGLEVAALRYGNVYGPGQPTGARAGVVGAFLDRLLAGQPLTIDGDGEQTRDWVFLTDVVAANVRAFAQPLPTLTRADSCAFNIGTGVEMSVVQLARHAATAVGVPIASANHVPARAGEVGRHALGIHKALELLAWRPQVLLAEGLALTAAWHRQLAPPLPATS